MSNVKRLRTHLLVDPKIQGTLIIRVLLYWVAGADRHDDDAPVLADAHAVPAGNFHSHFDEMWFYYEPALMASALLLPLVIMDMLRFTNQMIGPLLGVRRSMRALARGEYVEPSSSAARLLEGNCRRVQCGPRRVLASAAAPTPHEERKRKSRAVG